MRSIAIIGLSSFGHYLCKYLADTGIDVLAIDRNEARIDDVKSFVKKAVVADACDKETLAELGLGEFDIVVLSAGERIDTSTLITLYLRELGVKEILAKAVTEDHAKILTRIGATTIVFPERDMAERLSHTLRRGNLLDYFPLTGEYSMIELKTPAKWVGKSLQELNVRVKYNVQVIMIRDAAEDEASLIPSGRHTLREEDILVVLGRDEDLGKVEKL